MCLRYTYELFNKLITFLWYFFYLSTINSLLLLLFFNGASSFLFITVLLQDQTFSPQNKYLFMGLTTRVISQQKKKTVVCCKAFIIVYLCTLKMGGVGSEYQVRNTKGRWVNLLKHSWIRVLPQTARKYFYLLFGVHFYILN